MSELVNPCKVKGLGELVDCSDEQFKNHFATKNLTYCLNCYKLLNLTFEQVMKMVNDLVKLAEVKKTENKDHIIDNIKALHVNMGYIEHKATLLLSIIKEKTLSSVKK